MQGVISEVETLTLQKVHQTTELQLEQYRPSSGDKNIACDAALTRHNMLIYQFHDQILLQAIWISGTAPVTLPARDLVPDLRCL